MATVLLDLCPLDSVTRQHGIGRYLSSLARGLASVARVSRREDIEVRAVTDLPWLGAAHIEDDLDAAVDRLATPGRRMRSHAEWAYRHRLGFASAARAAKADLAHTGHPDATPLGRLTCPRITTCHDLIPYRWPDLYATWRDGWTAGRRRLDARRYGGADHIIAVSEATAADLVRLLGVPARKISVVLNGLDLGRFSPEETAEDRDALARHGVDGRPFVLYAGVADWRKNAVGMIAALARARRRRPSAGLVLLWAGGLDPATEARVEGIAEALGVRDAVLLGGYVSDDHLGALYRHAHALLFVSRSEGFGYPVVEAMASGCPVVTTRGSSLDEIAGAAAVRVDPEDHEGIADALVTLLDDPSERRRLSAAGLARAPRFGLERMATETLAIYRGLL
jgi:glycosyltransferase involved in cell wall biosynthesis